MQEHEKLIGGSHILNEKYWCTCSYPTLADVFTCLFIRLRLREVANELPQRAVMQIVGTDGFGSSAVG